MWYRKEGENTMHWKYIKSDALDTLSAAGWRVDCSAFTQQQGVQNNCDEAFGNMWQSSFLWLSQGLNPLALQHSVHFRRGSVPEFILWNDRLWQSAILQCFWHNASVLWGHWIMIWEQLLTISEEKITINYQFITHFVSSGRWPALTRRKVLKPQKEMKWTTTSRSVVVFPRAKQMFNQSPYRFQKSQCDKCSWKQPANRAMSDRPETSLRKAQKRWQA